jgi:hypothetical protein
MIIVNAKGGLGNQMFQYAIARAYAEKYSTEFKLDIRSLGSVSVYGYELERVFNIDESIAKSKDLLKVLSFAKNKYIYKIISKLNKWIKINKNILIEEKLKYDQKLMLRTGNLYLDGYWQSHKYFIDYLDKIKQDFNFKNELSELNIELKDKIHNSNSVSIHVRRGDYIANNNLINFACPLEYYTKSMDLISKEVENPSYFVFSDDINWARSNIKSTEKIYFIDINIGRNSYIDMQLMSYCCHHIIANSTFSWWGAMLSKNSTGIKIMPKKWFKDEGIEHDIHPNGWLLV